jgi:MFS family permease
VLNVVCLSLASVWLTPRERATARTFLLAAVLCGLAISIKLWGGLWFLAALVSVPPSDPNFSRRLRFFLIAGLVVSVLVFPLALAAPESFLNQVFLFHAHRPPDGEIERWPRLVTLFSGIRLFISAGVLVALLAGLTNRLKRSREYLFFSTAYALTVGAFLASTSYWSQYNAHLAASECVLAGAGVAMLHRAIGERWARANVLGGLFVTTVVVFPSLRTTVLYSWPKAPQQVAFGRALQQWVPPNACYFAFEPAWGVLGQQLPFHAARSPALVDVYATMLLDGLKDGARFSHVNDAFSSVLAQISIQNKLEHCRFVSLGGRGEWQLSMESKQWFYAHFVRRFPLSGEPGTDIWERTLEQ